RYQMKPSEPVIKDKPNKALILILGALPGAMFAIVGTLVYATLKDKTKLD
ncbi:TPA: chain-length determining protein, partial [Shigella sonnei]|nr:chain-length determining protein [Shigella sonnei]